MTNRDGTLDVVRGITIALMLVVNNPGSWANIYPILAHAKWDGFTFADFVFPSFLFWVGFSCILSISKASSSQNPTSLELLRVFRRSLILIFLGLFLNCIPDWNFANLRFPGVLQRIGVVYFLNYILFRFLPKQYPFLLFLLVSIAYEYSYFSIAPPDYLLQVPWTPSPEFHLGAYFDRMIFQKHLWTFTKVWDPEGLFSTFSSLGNSILGAYFAIWVLERAKSSSHSKGDISQKSGTVIITRGFLIQVCSGLGLVVIATVLSNWIPINKSVWSISFTLFSSGICILLYSGIHVVMTTNRISELSTLLFSPFGRNSILAFVLSGLFSKFLAFTKIGVMTTKGFLYTNLFLHPTLPKEFSSFLFSLAYLLLFYVLFLFLYRKKRFLAI